MNSRLVTAALLTLVLSSPAAGQSPGQSKPAKDNARFQATVATQKRINRYFHGVVVAKAKSCWDRLSGKGTIEFKYLYADDGKGAWRFKTIQASRSDLPKDQEKAAVVCMQKAVTATSFAREKGEKARSYTINWVWPVPFPPDADQQVARMWGSSGGEGGGCDGRGAKADCVACSGSPQSCVYVCVGGDSCELQPSGTFNSICTQGGQCSSGGLFGLAGVMSIY